MENEKQIFCTVKMQSPFKKYKKFKGSTMYMSYTYSHLWKGMSLWLDSWHGVFQVICNFNMKLSGLCYCAQSHNSECHLPRAPLVGRETAAGLCGRLLQSFPLQEGRPQAARLRCDTTALQCLRHCPAESIPAHQAEITPCWLKPGLHQCHFHHRHPLPLLAPSSLWAFSGTY